jgi:ribonuclease HI
MTRLQAWTDGGCRGNPGIGAWAFLIVDTETGKALERAGGDPSTTNNRMEMQAAVRAMESLTKDGSELLIHSDSKYLIDCCTQWMAGWKKKGWKKKGGELKNVDLLKELDALQQRHTIRWQWVKGHSGDPGNERVDELLNDAMDRLASGGDSAYEQRRTWP